ncbi:MAG: hypothetical protein JW801_14800 [Bacteroidales bacterium]|nr:hypothetical protein [Bacteroidales bacterium]
MLKRYVDGENALRKGIYREAIQLTKEGWHVMAKGIPGFHTPPEIEGYVPDIYAVLDEKTIIIDLLAGDTANDEAFKAHYHYARRDIATAYFCWELDAAGCRINV